MLSSIHFHQNTFRVVTVEESYVTFIHGVQRLDFSNAVNCPLQVGQFFTLQLSQAHMPSFHCRTMHTIVNAMELQKCNEEARNGPDHPLSAEQGLD